ncbi:MAG: hypothetical protein M3454_05110 [Actinomycetota bacterium]|nr:hypothetical protein [Actinomycetota bacterium]
MVDRVDDLFGLPLAEFTSSRNGLAAHVAARGDKTEARAIKSLRKPSVVGWTLNQLSRRHRETVERLVATYGGIGTAGSAEDVRSVTETRRQLVAELVVAARGILEESGSTSPQATLQKVSQALYAGGSEQDRELLLQGRLVGDLGSPSLDSAFGLLPSTDEERAASDEIDKELQTLHQEAGAAEQSAVQLEDAARRSEAEADCARAELTGAEQRARRARRKAEAARRLADEARIKVEEAQNATDGRGIAP